MSRAQVIFLKPAVLAAATLTGPYKETVPKAWNIIFNLMDQGKIDPLPDHGYGLTFDDPRKVAQSDLRYAAGVVVPANWNSCDTNTVTPLPFVGGTFLRTRVTGPYSNTGQVISKIRDQWIPKNGLVFDRAQPVLTIYRSDVRHVAPEEQIADVCLPVFADRRRKPRD